MTEGDVAVGTWADWHNRDDGGTEKEEDAMGWHWDNLTNESGEGDNEVRGTPTSHVFDAEVTQHVFHRAGANRVFEVWWRGGDAPQADSLLPVSTSPALFAVGNPVSHVFDPLDLSGTQHVFFRTPDGEIGEAWWSGGEFPHRRSLTQRSGEPANAVSDPTSHVFAFDGTQHVFYRTFDGEIVELWWTGGADGNPKARSLNTQQSGVPLATGNPASHVFAVEGQGPSTQHMFYRTGDGEIIELFWRTSDEPPQVRNLTTLSRGALLAASDPISHVFNREGTQHVFYTADNGDIAELWWSGGTNAIPQFENLTERAGGGPVPSGRLSSHVFEAERTQHVFFRTPSFSQRSPDPAIVELWWMDGGTPQFENLNERTFADAPPGTTRPGAPAPDGDPTSHVFDAENTQHVFYTTPTPEFSDLHEIVELWFKT